MADTICQSWRSLDFQQSQVTGLSAPHEDFGMLERLVEMVVSLQAFWAKSFTDSNQGLQTGWRPEMGLGHL